MAYDDHRGSHIKPPFPTASKDIKTDSETSQPSPYIRMEGWTDDKLETTCELAWDTQVYHIPDLFHEGIYDDPMDTHEKLKGPQDWFPRPFIHHKAPSHITGAYETVIAAKCPNKHGAHYPLQSQLNVEAWQKYKTGHVMDNMVLDGVRYGFPLQYGGGPIYDGAVGSKNHHSGRAFPNAVNAYISKELQLGALVGPFLEPPFTPWCKVSPIMTRPKGDSGSRRVIVDLSYPEGGINKYIQKNVIDGETVEHRLPTVQQAVDIAQEFGVKGVFLASIDISRAYRNFRTCPSDWPLLVIKHDGKYYLDTAVPFGSRNSSYYMGSIALFICRALEKKGITGLMYLDDLLLFAKDKGSAQTGYTETLLLLNELGLPVASHKLSPPTRDIVWLGIRFDLDINTLAIPDAKLEEMRKIILRTENKATMTIRELQVLIGVINHISKAVPPARLFMSRLLKALRETDGKHVKVSSEVLADIRWFRSYLRQFNGKAIIPDKYPVKIIEADACLIGMGAHDGVNCYAIPISEKLRESHSISRLECLNCLLAARTLLGEQERGKTVLIRCDNEASVYTYMYGRAKDSVMSACARGMWMLCATLNINLIVEHIPGIRMQVADALSRLHNDAQSRIKAQTIIKEMSLSRIYPKPHNLDYSAFL